MTQAQPPPALQLDPALIALAAYDTASIHQVYLWPHMHRKRDTRFVASPRSAGSCDRLHFPM